MERFLSLRQEITGQIRGISQMPVGDLVELIFTFPYLRISTLIPDHWDGQKQRATLRTNRHVHEETNERLDFLRSVAVATVERYAREYKRPPERSELRSA